MYVILVIWLISVFFNMAIVYPGTVPAGPIKNDIPKLQLDHNRKRRLLELNVTIWNFIGLTSFMAEFLIFNLPLPSWHYEIRAYTAGLCSSLQLGSLGAVCVFLLFSNQAQPDLVGSISVWAMGLILSTAITTYDLIVFHVTNDVTVSRDRLDLSARIFVYSTLTTWLLFALVNWVGLFFIYKKFRTISNGRRQKSERYMVPRAYVEFLTLKSKIHRVIGTNLFLSLSWIPYVVHVIVVGLIAYYGDGGGKITFEFDWREKYALGSTLTVTNTLTVPVLILINQETRKTLCSPFRRHRRHRDSSLSPNTNTITNKFDDDKSSSMNFSCREIANVGLVNIPELCFTDQSGQLDRCSFRMGNESEA